MLRRRVLKYYRNYLTIVSLADNNEITFVTPYELSPILTVYVSTNGGATWEEKTSTNAGTLLATLDNGDELLIKGTNTQYGVITNNGYTCSPSLFLSSQNIAIKGNVMSLIYGDDFEGKYEFPNSTSNIAGIFLTNANLVNIDDLVLPATTLTEQCYALLFYGCTGLTAVPNDLLPATTVIDFCYRAMFSYCSSLTTAPELPASSLAYNCYDTMFSNTKVNYVKCLAVDHSAANCTQNWLYKASSTGTFVKASSATWSRNASGIPSGWTIVNAS